MGVYGESLANRRMILLAVLSLIASLLAVGFNAPAANAAPGVSVTESASSTDVNEAGATTDSYDVVLTEVPSGQVIITVDIGATSEFIVDQGTLTFEIADFDTPQTVTVTAVDDAIDDGNSSDVIAHSAAGGGYDAVTIADVTVNVTDDDTAGFSISPITIAATEGGVDTYDVELLSQPTSTVTITVTDDAQVSNNSGGSLTFLTSNWDTAQTVTVTATDDAVQEGGHTGVVSHSAASSDPLYDVGAIQSVTMNITDNDTAGVTINQGGGVSVTEASGPSNTDTYTVVLDTQPAAPVTVDVSPSGSQATATASVSFTTGDWNSPKTVTVTGTDDAIDDGNLSETFTHSATSTDGNYNGISIGNVVATTIDDDTAGLLFTPTAVTAIEGGTNGTYTVELTSEPTASVVITVTPAGTQATAEATADPPNDELTFTTANWDQPQSVSVIADDDDVDDDGVGETIGHTGASTDPNYAGTFANVAVTITDNDDAGVTVTPASVSATEGGANGTYTVVLDSEPTSSVTININESSGEFSTSPTSLVFTAGNWFTARTVNVIANDDAIADGTTTGTITHSASSSDGNYNGGAVTIDPVGVTIIDDETPGISISGSPLATEGGANGTYTVVLTTMPSGPVSVALSATSGAGEFTIVTASPLTFTTGDYDQPQTVTVAAVNDDVIDGAQAGMINHVATGGGYNVADPQEVSVTVNDNDVAGVTVVESGGTTVVDEGGTTDTYTVVLTAEPKANVTVSAVPDAQVDVTPLARTFTPANWNVPQTFTVAGKSDGIDELPTHPGSVQHATASSDPDFDAIAVDTVIASVTDVDELLVTIDGPTFGAPGESSVFTAMVNAGATGTITYDWTVFFEGNPIANGDESTFQFTPANGGPHIIRALVGDDQGQNPAVFIQFTSLGDITGNVFMDDIIWLAEEGITKGCNPPANDLFCPAATVTRGQMAAFLVRFLGLTAIDPTIEFTDTGSTIFEQDILRLATAGITKGCNPPTNDRFCPNDSVTRGQMAAFLVRALALTDNGGGDLFTDDNTSIFENDIDRLATAGITKGCNPPANTLYCPNLTVTRGQMAAFLHRAEGLLP